MEIKTKSTRTHSLIKLFDMHTDYFAKAITGISDEDSRNRLNTKANHVAWLAGSLTQDRFEMASLITGKDHKQAADELFKNHQGIKDDAAYSPLTEFKKDWEKISPIFREAISGLSDEKLDSMFVIPEMPEMKLTWYDMVTFMAYREANCIGQIILWRRLMGYEGIRYDG